MISNIFHVYIEQKSYIDQQNWSELPSMKSPKFVFKVLLVFWV